MPVNLAPVGPLLAFKGIFTHVCIHTHVDIKILKIKQIALQWTAVAYGIGC